MFTTRYGTPIEPRAFSRSYENRIAKARVRRITVHDAQRTCGSLLADLDVHPRVATAIPRHAQFSITMEIYTQVSDKQTRAALRKLGDSLDGRPGTAVLPCYTGSKEATSAIRPTRGAPRPANTQTEPANTVRRSPTDDPITT